MSFPLLFQRIDEDKLFNLFSIYGNIVRIKILRNKPDHALVQMSDGFQAELAVHFLKASFHYPCLCLTKAHCTPSFLLLLLVWFGFVLFFIFLIFTFFYFSFNFFACFILRCINGLSYQIFFISMIVLLIIYL